MKLKVNLHWHTKEDPEDGMVIDYTALEAIDVAAGLGFGAMAITLHNKFFDISGLSDYANSKNILLISGIEKKVEGKEVVILNCDREVEKVNSFEDLRVYKSLHPEIFVLAPHPFFNKKQCLGKYLEENVDIFDAVELSWFYSKLVNLNKKGLDFSEKNNLPFIATSDAHMLDFVDKSYAVVETPDKSIKALFNSIKTKQFYNVTSPRNLFVEMILKGGVKHLQQKIMATKTFLYFKKVLALRNKTVAKKLLVNSLANKQLYNETKDING